MNPMFSFAPRWREELVVTGSAGSFVLQLDMGVYTAHLPDEQLWNRIAPEWAKSHWTALRNELSDWCEANKTDLQISGSAWLQSI